MQPHTKRRLAIALALAVTILLLCFIFTSFNNSNSKLPTGPIKPKVVLGFSHGVVLAGNGTLWTWGDCALGWHVLGLGPKIQTQPRLQQIGADTNWIDVATTGTTTIALKSDGSIWGWGYNLHSQINPFAPRNQPFTIPAVPGNDWKQVASGNDTLALKRDGTLWAWGDNWSGVLGNGTTNSSGTPVQVGSSTNWSRIWASGIQNVAQQNDGSLWFWGWDYTTSEKGSAITVPTRVSPDNNWVDVGMGEWMVFATKSNGTLWTWGRRAHIYSNATNTIQNSHPVQVGHDTDWRACAQFGSPCPLFMKRDGSLWCLDASDQTGVAVVTKIVQSLVINNQLTTFANNAILGTPGHGDVKTLRVHYQLDGKDAVATYREGSPVHLGAPGKSLKIIRALYGNADMFAEADAHPEREYFYTVAKPRRIDLNKDIVSFYVGRHNFGVALTADGEVWEWGETLGQPKYAFLHAIKNLAQKLGFRADWDEPPLVLDHPTRLEKSK